jgi:hypothetical protein
MQESAKLLHQTYTAWTQFGNHHKLTHSWHIKFCQWLVKEIMVQWWITKILWICYSWDVNFSFNLERQKDVKMYQLSLPCKFRKVGFLSTVRKVDVWGIVTKY